MHSSLSAFSMTVWLPTVLSSRVELHAGMRIKDLRSIDTLSREISHRNAAFTSGTGDFSTPFHRLHDTLSFTTMLYSARNDRGAWQRWCFIATGNYLRKVSYSAWHYGYSYRQETVCKRFPIRHDTMAIPTDRKLFAKGFLLGLAPWLSLLTGNCSQKVSYST